MVGRAAREVLRRDGAAATRRRLGRRRDRRARSARRCRTNPRVGHVTGAALYVDDLWPDVRARRCTRGRCRRRTRTRASRRLDAAPRAARRRAWSPCSPATTCRARTTSAPTRHDEPLFPTEVLLPRPAGRLGARRDARSRRARRRARSRSSTSRCRRSSRSSRRSRRTAFSPTPLRLPRGDVAAALARSAASRSRASCAIGGQEHFYLETQAALAWLRRERRHARALVDAAPVRDAGDRRARARRAAHAGRRASACAWAARSAARKCRPTPGRRSPRSARGRRGGPVRVRLTRELDMALTGKRHPFLARYRRRLRRRRPAAGAARSSCSRDGGWSLDLSRAGACGARCSTSTTPTSCRHVEVIGPRLPHAQDVAHRVPRLRRAAGHAGDRGDPRSRAARALGLPPHVVRERNFYRDGDATHYGQPVRRRRTASRASGRELKATSALRRRAAREIDALQRRAARTSKRGLAITPVKFGISFTATFFNQAGALVLIYRDGTVQVNHGGTEMGQGLLHQDPADRGATSSACRSSASA